MNKFCLVICILLCLATVSMSLTREQERMVGKTSRDMQRMMDYKDINNKVGYNLYKEKLDVVLCAGWIQEECGEEEDE